MVNPLSPPSVCPPPSGRPPGTALAVLEVAQMVRADQAAMAAGVSGPTLMEAAGWAVARAIRSRWTPRRTVVLCGPGNNGGDGFVVARLLALRGWPVTVMLLGNRAALRGDAAWAASRWSGAVEPLSVEGLALEGGARTELVVDALFGAGLARPIDGLPRAVLETVAERRIPCVGVDMPSGVEGDTGQVLGFAAPCALTVTFFRPKPGHLLFPGRGLCGVVDVADIGIPATVLDETVVPACWVNGPGLWRLPVPGAESHKYRRGHAVVRGGDRLTGAARLAARAARRAGVGLLTVASDPAVSMLYAADQPGVMPWRLGLDGAGVDGDWTDVLADPRRNAVLVGPGAGRGERTAAEALAALAARKAVVLDADALPSLAGHLPALRQAGPGRAVLTPHDGEFAALFGADLGEAADPARGRLSRARAAAAACGQVVVLKGADTVVAAPDGRAAIMTEAPPWLATGGTGDVLAGLVLGLLAQGMAAFEAAAAAVWLHGKAAQRVGPGLIAEDLPDALPAVLAEGLGAALPQ